MADHGEISTPVDNQNTGYRTLLDATGPAPEPPIASEDPAPPLEADLIFAESWNGEGGATIVGEAGFADFDILEVCIENISDGTSAECFPTEELEGDVVFQAEIAGAEPGDVLAIWGENSDLYQPGGVGINAVKETVEDAENAPRNVFDATP